MLYSNKPGLSANIKLCLRGAGKNVPESPYVFSHHPSL